MDKAMAKNADPRCVAEEQDKAKNLQTEDAVTRSEGFPANGPARLQRAHRPGCDKDDPRAFNEITPNHASSTVRSRVRPSCSAKGVIVNSAGIIAPNICGEIFHGLEPGIRVDH